MAAVDIQVMEDQNYRDEAVVAYHKVGNRQACSYHTSHLAVVVHRGVEDSLVVDNCLDRMVVDCKKQLNSHVAAVGGHSLVRCETHILVDVEVVQSIHQHMKVVYEMIEVDRREIVALVRRPSRLNRPNQNHHR